MTIHNGSRVKVVQTVHLPGSVVTKGVFYYKADFAESQQEADIVDALELRMEAIYEELNAHIVDGASMGVMDVYEYDSVAAQWDLLGSANPSVTFAATGDMLPHGVALLLRAYTVNPRVIGRKYFPGFDEAVQADGEWNATVLTDAAAAGADWGISASVDVNNKLDPGVFSTVLLDVIELTDVFVALANPAYQRRRRPGVGE